MTITRNPQTWPAWLSTPPRRDPSEPHNDDTEGELREARAYWRRARDTWRRQHVPNLNRVDFERLLRSNHRVRVAAQRGGKHGGDV